MGALHLNITLVGRKFTQAGPQEFECAHGDDRGGVGGRFGYNGLRRRFPGHSIADPDFNAQALWALGLVLETDRRDGFLGVCLARQLLGSERFINRDDFDGESVERELAPESIERFQELWRGLRRLNQHDQLLTPSWRREQKAEKRHGE
jgi:hypothetical protein